MKLEVRAIIGIFILCIVLAFTGFYIRSVRTGQKLLSPFSKPLNIFTLLGSNRRPSYIVYGYLPYWMLDNSGYLQMDKLTHIAYFGLYINKDGTFKQKVLGEDGTMITEPGLLNWHENTNLDKIISNAKAENVRFSLTVIAHDDEQNDEFLSCRTCWATLLENLKKELDLKQIKDINLNFEYVEYTEKGQAAQFAELTKYLNEELDKIYGDSFVVVSAFADSPIKD